MLAIIVTALPILSIIALLLIIVFFVYPKIKNSDKIDTLTNDMTSEGKDRTTTGAIVDGINKGVESLKQKKDDLTKTAKDVAAESKIIDKVLNKDKK